VITATAMTLKVFEVHALLQAFSSAIFFVCGTWRGGSPASAELLVAVYCAAIFMHV